MYAVINTGGKQYRIEPGERLEVERLAGGEGSEVELTPVLVVDGDTVLASRSQLAGATVTATIVGATRWAEDQRLHLQAEEQQPPSVRPPPGPLGDRDHGDQPGQEVREEVHREEVRPTPLTARPLKRMPDVEEEGRGFLAQRS